MTGRWQFFLQSQRCAGPLTRKQPFAWRCQFSCAAGGFVEGPAIGVSFGDLLPVEVEFGVLQAQHHRMRTHALLGLRPVRCQNVSTLDLVIDKYLMNFFSKYLNDISRAASCV